jgi:hypothetical protein
MTRRRRKMKAASNQRLHASVPALAQCDPPEGADPPWPASGVPMPRTPWIRCQCAWQLVCTGVQVSGPSNSLKLITGWNVAPLSSLAPRL